MKNISFSFPFSLLRHLISTFSFFTCMNSKLLLNSNYIFTCEISAVFIILSLFRFINFTLSLLQ
ncbi:hypothetical protein C2G38_2064322 [Gigaspora rosea]|uniref:Uncharacterized protein n=1 Tax=Gigaspora rosea TaxID=44941 RepID=A0A397VXZ9_9GLOM|nr:hypothetical protein C2G38_2064322 [Gigaspora rosea]